MSRSSTNNEGAGCALLLGIVAIAIGAGSIWGAGIGMLVFGGVMLLLVFA